MPDTIRVFNISLIAAGFEHFQLKLGAAIIQLSERPAGKVVVVKLEMSRSSICIMS